MEHHRTRIHPSKSIILSMMSPQGLRTRLSCAAMCKHKFIEGPDIDNDKKVNTTSCFEYEREKVNKHRHRVIYQ